MTPQFEFLSQLLCNHPDLNGWGFAHVTNVSGLVGVSAFEVTNELIIRKAIPREVETLKRLVEVTGSLDLSEFYARNPYETATSSVEREPGRIRYLTTDLSPEHLRYTVIAFKGSNISLLDFVDASMLTNTRLELGHVFVPFPSSHPSIVSGTGLRRALKHFERTDEFVELGLSDLQDLQATFHTLNSLIEDSAGVRSAMKRFAQLDDIPDSSALKFLGFVSILESLITHAPDPKDPYDSLTRQVRQKMLLLSRRSVIKIPYGLFAIDTKPETLWNRLYEYRSAVAHGSRPDFKGKLSCLKDADTALKFIRSAVMAVMRQALEEPQLIADLHAC